MNIFIPNRVEPHKSTAVFTVVKTCEYMGVHDDMALVGVLYDVRTDTTRNSLFNKSLVTENWRTFQEEVLYVCTTLCVPGGVTPPS